MRVMRDSIDKNIYSEYFYSGFARIQHYNQLHHYTTVVTVLCIILPVVVLLHYTVLY